MQPARGIAHHKLLNRIRAAKRMAQAPGMLLILAKVCPASALDLIASMGVASLHESRLLLACLTKVASETGALPGGKITCSAS